MSRRGLAAFVCGWLSGVACGGDDDCPEGSEMCPCTSDGLCLEGLECLSDYCVDPDWMPGEDGGGAVNDGDDDGGSFDNVAACEALVDSIECGTSDLSMAIDCSIYTDFQCDVADYFTCVADNVTCNGDTLDVSQISQCAELATCG